MLTINEIQDEIIEEFSGLDDWMDRYQLLIDMGGETEPLPDSDKVEQNLIDGCQSRVWLQADYDGSVITFTADSDALIVKGIIARVRRKERPPLLSRRERRTYSKRYSNAADSRAFGAHSRRDTGRRPVLHREDRPARAPLANAQQRSPGHAETNACLCHGVQGKGRAGVNTDEAGKGRKRRTSAGMCVTSHMPAFFCTRITDTGRPTDAVAEWFSFP